MGEVVCPHTLKVTVKKKEKEEKEAAEKEDQETVKCDKIRLECYPNPSTGSFQLNITSQEELKNVPIYFSNPDGKVLSIKNVSSSPYTETVLYNVSGLSKGHYMLSTPCQNTSTYVTITIQ